MAFSLACWPEGLGQPRLQTLLRTGLVVAAVTTLVALLLQGPYAAGQPLTRLFDRSLMAETAHASFGAWTQLRLYLYLFLAAVLWPADSLRSRFGRWAATLGVLASAVTYSGTGHAAASGGIADRVVDSAHLLAAGVWVGGLVTLAVSATARPMRPTLPAFAAFSRMALLSVLALAGTGVVTALLRVDSLGQLRDTSYGRLLSLKLVLVALALATAGASRRRLGDRLEPWSTVRLEAALTVAVLAVTAVLASTSPPTRPVHEPSGHPARAFGQ